MRKRALLVVVAAVVGATSGAAVSLVTAPRSEEDPTPARPRGGSRLSAELLEEVRTLRGEIHELLDRVRALETRPDPVAPAPLSDKNVRKELAALADRIEDLSRRAAPREVAGVPVGVDPSQPTPEFAAKVERTLNSIRRREKADGWRTGTKKAQARMDDRLARLQKDLDLTNNQVDDMRTELTAQSERNLELIRLWEQGNTPDRQLGEIKGNNHRLHQEALRRILTPDQLQRFEERRGEGGK